MIIHHNSSHFFYTALFVISLTVTSTTPAADKPLHLRGEITSVTGNQLVVKANHGTTTTLQLSNELQVLDVFRTELSAVAENSYVGVAAAPAGAGKLKALGVMVFPEGARGLNEGHFPWDLQKKSTMTNATVAKLLKKENGAEVEVRYGDKTQTISIDTATIFGQFVPGTRTLLVKGAKILIFANPTEGSLPIAEMIMVGRAGFLPPI